MITSKQIINISEEYCCNKNVNGQELVVYKNPSSSELSSLYIKGIDSIGNISIRFLADARSSGTVYVWNAYLAHHGDVRKLVGFSPHYTLTPYTIDGEATVINGKAKMYAWVDLRLYTSNLNNYDENMNQYFLKIFSYNWTWLDRYVDSSSYINTLYAEFKNYIARHKQ